MTGLAEAVHIPVLTLCFILTYRVYLCKYVDMYIVIKHADYEYDSGQYPDPPFAKGGCAKKMQTKLSRKTLE